MNYAPSLMACCWTIAGDACPGTAKHLSPFPLEDRIKAAAVAGYTGVGLWHGDLLQARKRLSDAEIAACLRAHGITSIEVEHLAGWFTSGAERAASDQVRADLFAAASALGARQLKIVPPFGNVGYTTAHLTSEFRTLCQQAAAHGLLVALEMIPFSDVATLDAAEALVRQAACPNGGLLVDIWHLYRSGGTLAALAQIPREYLMAVEICDAAAVPLGTPHDDSMRHRKLCGEGALDITGFIATLDKAGYAGPYSVEILSDELRQLPLDEAARRSFATARRLWR
jgi:sugar phosphate isomerase/epimerase